MATVSDILHKAPHKPGVYLMKNRSRRVFYVGKAKDLHKRMHQYISPGSDTRHFVTILDKILASVEFIITASEKEALLLENIQIKKYRPKYNVLINDDKQYFSLKLDSKKDYPRLEVVRRRKKSTGLHFGPYSSATKARRMLGLVNKYFMLRDCSDMAFLKATRPCVRHQMGRCHAPCTLQVSKEDYLEEVKRVRLFLEGRKELLIANLKPLMVEAAKELDFEQAAKFRDQIEAISGSLERQVIDLPSSVDWDILGFVRDGELAVFAVLRLRGGVMRGCEPFEVSCRAISDKQIVSGFIKQYYAEAWPLPEKILLPIMPNDKQTLESWLSERRGFKLKLSKAQRGSPARLVKIAEANALQNLSERKLKRENSANVLSNLQKKLSLKNFPNRIECVDISNMQGKLAVGSMVCFLAGKKASQEYRKFKIRIKTEPDDFAMMHEVLSRRFVRGKLEGNLPDMLVVDGGKGQLNIALSVLKEIGIKNVDVVSLAKSKLKQKVAKQEIAEEFEGKMRTPERVFLPHIKNPVILKPGTAELGLLEQLRDEAHRFAITYHRQLRSKKNLRSGLLDIPSIGQKRAKALLAHFGSLKRIRSASKEEIAKLTGFNLDLARNILEHLE